ncbi:MAG: hypothetical protein UT55_C0010G0011 [Candidatus Peregrinibacteria bacterium GW2011_GWE2_39_6]|nr:MAG: hypothetical protein UT36_C0006G0012 [Candidatus Peregrinibacteria bacterium GW2011_GWF2_39_17]KKR26348.1 MAG: hypothetical protein UT55_C0010G0011 [Candidatus Peregrinibacteria bacterium GW2011_GWE2_39_6]
MKFVPLVGNLIALVLAVCSPSASPTLAPSSDEDQPAPILLNKL